LTGSVPQSPQLSTDPGPRPAYTPAPNATPQNAPPPGAPASYTPASYTPAPVAPVAYTAPVADNRADSAVRNPFGDDPLAHLDRTIQAAHEEDVPDLSNPGTPPVTFNPPTAPPSANVVKPDFGDRFRLFTQDVWLDYQNYYSWQNLCYLGLGIGGAGVLAETPLDEHFRDWYQSSVRSSGTNNVAAVFKNFGEAEYMVPGIIGLTLAGELLYDYPLGEVVGDYGERVCRGYLVGAPPMLALQYALGSSRPGWKSYNSQWHPFVGDNAVSGHAFVSSVPFITAADMVDDPFLKGALYFGSTITAWSRINDDAHYLSQAVLGWWMGYLAVRSVDRTQAENAHFSMAPLITPDMSGVAMTFTW
jgi:membrane-associated phospholipid phosphatase